MAANFDESHPSIMKQDDMNGRLANCYPIDMGKVPCVKLVISGILPLKGDLGNVSS